MAARAVKIVYIFKTNIIFFFGNEYTSFSEGIYFSGKNIILFRQKVYTFHQKEIMLLYISDIQLIILSPTIRENAL